jgi:hypothetical protein
METGEGAKPDRSQSVQHGGAERLHLAGKLSERTVRQTGHRYFGEMSIASFPQNPIWAIDPRLSFSFVPERHQDWPNVNVQGPPDSRKNVRCRGQTVGGDSGLGSDPMAVSHSRLHLASCNPTIARFQVVALLGCHVPRNLRQRISLLFTDAYERNDRSWTAAQY